MGKLAYDECANSVFVKIVTQEDGFDSGEGPVGG